MFSRIIPAAILFVSVGWAVSFAQLKIDNPDVKSKANTKIAPIDAKDEGVNFEMRMIDGTVMKVMLLDKSMSLATKYGKLVVPAADLRRLDFGFRYPDGVEAKIEKAVSDLGSQDFQTREGAEKRLIKIGLHAIPLLRRAVKSENPELVHRSEIALKNLEGKLEDGKPELNDYDVVDTAEFTVKGRLEGGIMSVRTKYFGDTTVNFTDIRSFHSVGQTARTELSLDAAKYGKMNQFEWMETSILLIEGQMFEVSASGKVDQWPQTPGQYMVGPEGLAINGNRFGMVANSGLPGQLIGRIGPNGPVFSIGASLKSKATESGKLYLQIGPSPWNCPSSGAYKIIVMLKNP